MNSHITLSLEQRFNHPSLTSGTKDLILQHLPQPTCSGSGERCFGNSWAPGRNKISSVSEYLLNTLIFCWRIQPVFSVPAESICTRNLLQDVDKMEAPSLTCRCRDQKGDAGVEHNHSPKSCTNLFCTYRVNEVSDSQKQKGLKHGRGRQGHSKCQQWAGRMEWCMLCAVPLQRSPSTLLTSAQRAREVALNSAASSHILFKSAGSKGLEDLHLWVWFVWGFFLL